MKNNGLRYTAFGPEQFYVMASLGFTGNTVSQDGLIMIADRGSSEDCEECDDTLARPPYITATMAPNWPHMNNIEAHAIVTVTGISGEAYTAVPSMEL